MGKGPHQLGLRLAVEDCHLGRSVCRKKLTGLKPLKAPLTPNNKRFRQHSNLVQGGCP